MTEQEFVHKEFIQAIEELKSNSSQLIKLTTACHLIESLGVFLDKKPFACPGQSQKRFDIAINSLFSEFYQKTNRKSFFYFKFRCHLIHYYQLHRQYFLVDSSEEHLRWDDTRIGIHADTLLTDVQNAAKQLIELWEKGSLKKKKTSAMTGLGFGKN